MSTAGALLLGFADAHVLQRALALVAGSTAGLAVEAISLAGPLGRLLALSAGQIVGHFAYSVVC